jgi:hypothetical protein
MLHDFFGITSASGSQNGELFQGNWWLDDGCKNSMIIRSILRKIIYRKDREGTQRGQRIL